MWINILGSRIYATFLLKNEKILAYSLHYDKERSLRHLEFIRRFHKLEGEVVDKNDVLKEWLENKISGFLNGDINVSLDLSIYRNHEVYNILLGIPRGKTITYSELSRKSGKKIFETILALASNPFLILIPCHRVIKKDGNIGGYTPLGKDFKEKLLKVEGAI